MARIDVYEIDHPASQAWKHERASELGLQAPTRLHYAPVDFELQTLTEGLGQAGFDFTAPVFFSLLGVTQYLTRPAVLQTLGDIATISSAPVTLVLEFVRSPTELNREDAEAVRATAEGTARVGEPWLTFFGLNEMEEALRDSGFGAIRHFDPATAHARYLHDRTDGATLPGFARLTRADRT